MKATALDPVSNDAESQIISACPYIVRAAVTGTTPILFHRWSVENVAGQAGAGKGSRAKKTDNVKAYVYGDQDGMLAIPSEYFRMSVIGAAKFRQDPRSPRKSATDLFKAGLSTTHELCSLGVRDWDYIDQRRVSVQRSGITRCRPAMNAGWKTEVGFQVLLPEYIDHQMLNEVCRRPGD